jgi:hypothetical protein
MSGETENWRLQAGGSGRRVIRLLFSSRAVQFHGSNDVNLKFVHGWTKGKMGKSL